MFLAYSNGGSGSGNSSTNNYNNSATGIVPNAQPDFQHQFEENRKFDMKVANQIKPFTLESVRGDISTKIYHAVDHTRCNQYDLISSRNSFFFMTQIKARVAGYSPCKLCFPNSGLFETISLTVGNRKSYIYHINGSDGCEYSKLIAPENRVYLGSAANAISEGFRACKLCYPSRPDPSWGSEVVTDIEDINPDEYYIDEYGRTVRGSEIIDEYNESVREYNESLRENDEYEYYGY